MKRIFFNILPFLMLILAACTSNNTTTTPSSEAELSSFYLAANDSFPGLKQAVFTIKELADTALVYNEDSIRFGTPLDKVVPKFSFTTKIAWASLHVQDTTFYLSGSDTIDLTEPVYLTVCSEDQTKQHVYKISASVHQVDPDLYQWKLLSDAIYDADDSEQGMVMWHNELLLFRHTGTRIMAYRSADGREWSAPMSIESLPVECTVRQIVSDAHTLYYGAGHQIFRSDDAVNWTALPVTDSILSTLMYYNGTVWFSIATPQGVELAVLENDELMPTGLQPQAQRWPVSGFAAATFTASNGRPRALILGGYAANGEVLNSRWQLEWTPYQGYRMEEFSATYPKNTALVGTTMAWYNRQLMLFGGKDAQDTYQPREVLVSTNEGTTFYMADTTKNCLPERYEARYNASVLTDGEYLYLVGGRDAQGTTHSDVYRGHLNSINW